MLLNFPHLVNEHIQRLVIFTHDISVFKVFKIRNKS